MVQTIQQQGVVQVVPPAVLNAALAERDKAKAQAALQIDDLTMSNLASHIMSRFEIMRAHRNSASGWSNRLLDSLRAFNGEYDAAKLNEINKFGGSKVYARIIAQKCRGATSLLRDVYLGPDKPWGIAPPADPDVPPNIMQGIQTLVMTEMQALLAQGQPMDPDVVRDRINVLMMAARGAAKEKASTQAKITEDKIQELLDEGGFYTAFAEFLVDLPLFPFAVLKGPIVRVIPTVQWQGGTATIKQTPRLFWERVSPFDYWFTPGVTDIEDAECVEKQRLTRASINDMLDLPGYNHDAVRAVLDEYGRGGLSDNWDQTDAERAVQENRESPTQNQSGLISCLEYHGNVQGRMLLEQGVSKKFVDDELRDYMVQAWLIGRHVIKVQMSPSPRKRHPYFVTSFEKVPGTVVGNGLPDILEDIQDVANATLRSLVNNLSMASGPQAVINADRIQNMEDAEDMYPWKRWMMTSDPMSNNTQPPVSFFQPTSNAQELLQVYQAFVNMADEASAIPKYQTGAGTTGGAGRTASGLAMLMGNAAKILQTVSANVDRDVVRKALHGLYDLLMLTDKSGLLTGEETIRVLGVNVAQQRETQRARQLEFLQITANPIDMQIMGPQGRAKVLRKVSDTIGIDGEDIVPDPKNAPAAMPPAGAPGSPAAPNMAAQAGQAQGNQPPAASMDMGPRTNITGGVG